MIATLGRVVVRASSAISPASYMRGLAYAAVFCGTLAGGSVRALDFQVHEFAVQEDGFTKQQTFLQNDARSRVLITLPANWNTIGDAATLTMTPPGAAGGMARIERSLFSPDVVFKDRGLEGYRQQALAAVPQGATGVKILEEHGDAFPYFHWQGYELVVSYEFFGQNFLRSSLFVNMNTKEQLLLTAMAPKDAYKGVRDTAMDTLRSWQVITVENPARP